MVDSKNLELFLDHCREVAKYNLVCASSGNLSWKIDDDHFLLSGSGCWLENIQEEQVAIIELKTGSVLNKVVPSSEILFHQGILRSRPEVSMVLHFQSPAATAIACCAEKVDNYNIIPEIPYHIGKIKDIKYGDPGSTDFSDNVVENMKECNLVNIQNHGQVTIGKNFQELMQRALFFEFACNLLSKVGGKHTTISKAAIEKLYCHH